MQLLKLSVYLLLLFMVTGCGLLRENTIYELENGRYKNTTTGMKQKVWAKFEDTVIRLCPLQNKNESKKNSPKLFSFTEVSAPGSPYLKLKKSSFDIDVLTIPFKYRPSVKGFPNQLNANFSGAVYAGLRNDFYHFKYDTNDIGENRRKLNHLGVSFGLFCY